MRKGLIKIFPINTMEQIAGTLTKAETQNEFQHYFGYMCGK
jgi:hypothetical protein